MPAYVVVDITVQDRDDYERYKSPAAAAVAAYGGRYLVRSGKSDVREGEWSGTRTVILEFPSLVRALEWYDSPEYKPLRPIRQANSRASIAFFEGVADPTA